MPKIVALTEEDCVSLGHRYGSEAIALEAKDHLAAWATTSGPLGRYGYGAAARARFEALVLEHTALREKRPDAVSEKTKLIAARDRATAAAWSWVDTAVSLLGTVASARPELAIATNDAYPSTDAKLDASIPALAKLLSENAALFDAEAEVGALVAEGPAIVEALRTAPGAASAAKNAPIADTRELDLLDGRLYVIMRGYNDAVRKAIRKGVLPSTTPCRFTHLNRNSPKKPAAAAS